MPTRSSAWVALVLGLSLVACGTPGGSPTTQSSPSTRPSVGASAPAGAVDCPALTLLSPTGKEVDVTGSWTGGVTIHEVRQFDSCVWWVGLSSWPGDELGSAWQLAFKGAISSDFTLRGDWAEMFTVELHAPRLCPVTFRIEFVTTGGVEEVVLENDDPDREHPCAYYATTLHRIP
jgi:hypothetical protein